MGTLIGAVGYRQLRDHSAPFVLLERLEAAHLGPDITVEDVSYNPIALMQWLQGDAKGTFEHAIFIASVERAGRAPGRVDAYRWDGVLPSEQLIQQAVADAVTGIISLDNTLVIAGYFQALPPRVAIVEIEPREHEFGTTLSPDVTAAVEIALDLTRTLATDHAAFEALPPGGLGVRPRYGVQVRDRGPTPASRKAEVR